MLIKFIEKIHGLVVDRYLEKSGFIRSGNIIFKSGGKHVKRRVYNKDGELYYDVTNFFDVHLYSYVELKTVSRLRGSYIIE